MPAPHTTGPRAARARTPRATRTTPRTQENSVPMVGVTVTTVTESGIRVGLVIRSDDFMGATAMSPDRTLFAIEPGQSWARVTV